MEDRNNATIAGFTRKLFWATVAIVAVGISTTAIFHCDSNSQISRTDMIIARQKTSDSLQRAKDSLQYARDSIRTASQDTFQAHLLDSTGKQIAVMRDQEIRQLRAYVYINEMSPAKNYSRELSFKNVGVTPAYNYQSITFTQAISLANPVFIAPPPDTSNHSKFTIPDKTLYPGESAVVVTALKTFNKDTLDAIKKGKFAVFIWGGIFYKDAFGIERYKNFRMRYGWRDPTNEIFTTDEGNDSN